MLTPAPPTAPSEVGRGSQLGPGGGVPLRTDMHNVTIDDKTEKHISYKHVSDTTRSPREPENANLMSTDVKVSEKVLNNP